MLERILSREDGQVLPSCIGGQRACPPDDVGGVHGYEEFLQAYLDKRHPGHSEMIEWAGEDFEPERFDVEYVNSIFSAN